MGVYFVPAKALPDGIGRRLELVATYAELKAKCDRDEILFGCYYQCIAGNFIAPFLYSEEELKEWKRQTGEAQVIYLGYFAVNQLLFEEVFLRNRIHSTFIKQWNEANNEVDN